MRLSAKAILNFANVNSFSYGNQWTITSGDTQITLYFQLFDLDMNPGPLSQNATFTNTSNLRYIAGTTLTPPTVPSLNVSFPSIICSDVVTVAATQNTIDKSIWSLVLPSSNLSSGNVLFTLTEGSSIRNFSVINLLALDYATAGQNNGCC